MVALLFGVIVFGKPFLASASEAFPVDLSFGSRNKAEVMKLQEFLSSQGLFQGPVSGNFFAVTQKAVKDFQKQYGISPISGYWGPKTRAKANSLQVVSSGTSPIAPTSTVPVAPTLPASASNSAKFIPGISTPNTEIVVNAYRYLITTTTSARWPNVAEPAVREVSLRAVVALSIAIESGKVTIAEYGGTNWRWIEEKVLHYYENGSKLKTAFTSSNYFFLFDPERTEEYSEKVFNEQGEVIAQRSYQSPEETKDYKEAQLQKFRDFPESFSSTTYSGANYYLVPYFHTHEEFKAKDFGIDTTETEGAYLMKGGEIAWETSMRIRHISPSDSIFEDVNGDGIKEIVITDYVSEANCLKFIVYKWYEESPIVDSSSCENKQFLNADELDKASP